MSAADRLLVALAVVAVVAAGAVGWSRPAAPPAEAPQTVADWPALAAVGPRAGPADAPVQLVVFSDYECPYCRAFDATLDGVRTTFGDSVAVVYRALPLPGHVVGFELARGAVCAEEQEAFAAYHRVAFETAQAAPEADRSPGVAAVRASVPDVARFEACVAREAVRERVVDDVRAARALDLATVPVAVVNGALVQGAVSADSLAALVRTAAPHSTRP